MKSFYTTGNQALSAYMCEENGTFAEGTVMAVRKTKSGEKEINARPMVVELRPTSDDSFFARLMLTERESIKPDLLISLLADMAGVEAPEARVHRLLLLGEDGEGNLKPLMEL